MTTYDVLVCETCATVIRSDTRPGFDLAPCPLCGGSLARKALSASPRVDMLCRHVASDLQLALHEVADNFGARCVVERGRNAAMHVAGAVATRAELIGCDEAGAREASSRSYELISWVDDHVTSQLQLVLDRALNESVRVREELKQLREQVDRAARSVLASTHNSRRRT